MHQASATQDSAQVNLFSFPSETDSRFLLLVIAVAGTILVLVDGVAGSIFGLNISASFFIALAVTGFVFVWAFKRARQDAKKEIERRKLKQLPFEGRDYFETASLHQLTRYVEAVVEAVPDVEAKSTRFVWDEQDRRSNGKTFGFGSQKFVLLRQGLHRAFTQLPESNTFNAVLLHELGHLVNRDVSKTIFSIALGKSFWPTAIAILGVFNLYTILSLIFKVVSGRALTSVSEGLPVIIEVNLKTLALIALVEIIRSSILRVREYYADAYAKQSLGTPEALIDIFSTEPLPDNKVRGNQARSDVKLALSELRQSRLRQAIFMLWTVARRSFHRQIAPLHPSHRRRIAALKHTHLLFRPSYEVAFLSGLLSGLALNSSFVISAALGQLGEVLQSINQGISDSNNGLLVLIAFIVVTALFLIYLLSIALLVSAFGLVPVVLTIGLQIQSAAFIDQLPPDKPDNGKLTSLNALAGLALAIGVGFVLGCMLVPIPKAFSLWRVSLLALIPYPLGWAIVFFCWMLPLRALSGRVYIAHQGSEIPKHKRRWLTSLSALALLPTFAAMSAIQILSARFFNPELLPSDSVGRWIVLWGVLGALLSGILWAVSWAVLKKKGWLDQPGLDQLHPGRLEAWAEAPPPLPLPAPHHDVAPNSTQPNSTQPDSTQPGSTQFEEAPPLSF